MQFAREITDRFISRFTLPLLNLGFTGTLLVCASELFSVFQRRELCRAEVVSHDDRGWRA